jgi:hypothetical protein
MKTIIKAEEQIIVWQQIPLSKIAEDLALTKLALYRLRALGVNSAEGLLGIAYTDPEGLAQELEIAMSRLSELIDTLRKRIPPDVLGLLDREYRLHQQLPLGAELGSAPDVGVIDEYEEA